MKVAPRFFCEHCGAEVPRKADKCPGCGRYFANVKCPKCGFIGGENLFEGGCPVCGYSATASISPQRPPSQSPGKGNGPKSPAEPLPLWIYGLVFALLCVVVAAGFALL